MNLKNVFKIAKYSFLETFQTKILYVVVVFGLVLALLSFIGAELSYAVSSKIALDLGLGLLSLMSVGISIFMGSQLISKEIENRTLYMIITRPVSRSGFYFGKILGLSGIIAVNILILSLFTLSSYKILGGVFDQAIFYAVLFSIFEALLLLVIVIFFSLICNQVLTVVFSILVFVTGHAVEGMLPWLNKPSYALMYKVADVYSKIFPMFSKLNIKDHVVYKKAIPFEIVGYNTAYFLIYFTGFVFIGCFIFNKKSLD